MARTTISIADDLKKRMDAVSEPVNWSQVAARAFEQILGDIASRKQNRVMNNVVQRLRASRIATEDKDYRAGQSPGVRWAQASATWAELDNLAQALEEPRYWDGVPSAPDSWSDVLLHSIDPVRFEDPGEAEEFWQEWGSGRSLTREYLRGFADGAVEVFRQVESRV
jgi:hypothetical protein